MGGQRALQRSVADEPAADAASSVGDNAPLRLEQFLPYQLNVVANLVSQAQARVYALRSAPE